MAASFRPLGAPMPSAENDAPGVADDYRVPSDRESLGKMVRRVWVEWASEQENPKPSWLVPWDDLTDPDREVDRRIGEALYLAGYVNGLATRVLPPGKGSP